MTAASPDLPALIAELKALGMTYDEIAKEVDVSQPTISRWAQGSEPSYRKIDAIVALLRRKQGLTDKTGTLTYVDKIRLHGSVDVQGGIHWLDAVDEKDIVAKITLPIGSLGFVAPEEMASGRLRANELVVVGPSVDPDTILEQDAVVVIEEGASSRSVFASVHEGRQPGLHFLVQGRVQLWDRRILRAYPLIAILDPRAWIARP